MKPRSPSICCTAPSRAYLGEENDILVFFSLEGLDLRPKSLKAGAQVIEQSQNHVFHGDVEQSQYVEILGHAINLNNARIMCFLVRLPHERHQFI